MIYDIENKEMDMLSVVFIQVLETYNNDHNNRTQLMNRVLFYRRTHFLLKPKQFSSISDKNI